MTGMRELSVIQTPPRRRLAVRPYACLTPPLGIPFRCARRLLREHYRGGQSFIVVPAHSRPSRHRGFSQETCARIDICRRAWETKWPQRTVEERMSAFYEPKIIDCSGFRPRLLKAAWDIPSATR